MPRGSWAFTKPRRTCGRPQPPGSMAAPPRRAGGSVGRGTACATAIPMGFWPTWPRPWKRNKLDMNTSLLDDLYSAVDRLLGRTPDDAEMQAFLSALGHWPLQVLGPEDFNIYLEDEARGFCLLFEDCSVVPHPLAASKPAETPIFTGCFFYAEGVEGYHAYAGALPYGITWSDTASSLVSKLGPPKNEMKSKRTGLLIAHRWPAGQWLLTARYSAGGSSLGHLYVGIY